MKVMAEVGRGVGELSGRLIDLSYLMERWQ